MRTSPSHSNSARRDIHTERFTAGCVTSGSRRQATVDLPRVAETYQSTLLVHVRIHVHEQQHSRRPNADSVEANHVIVRYRLELKVRSCHALSSTNDVQ